MNSSEFEKRRLEIVKDLDYDINTLNKGKEESQRVANLVHNSEKILDDLDDEFCKQTGLDKTDIKFLFFATALQIGKWVAINKIDKIISDKIVDSRVRDNDANIKRMEREARDKFKNKHNGDWLHNKSEKYPTWLEIVYDGVPYDVSIGSPNFGVNMEGGYHRIHTLGHDPLLGWIFGTMNIISSTITLEDFRTFKVSTDPKPKHWEYETNVFDGFRMTIESIKEDKKRLPAAIFAQALHLKSDAYTKLGLPIPVLGTFSPDFASDLYKRNYDSLCLIKDLAITGTQAGCSTLINMIIGLIHSLYYDPNLYSSRDIYEVKTRKILMYSNLIASMSNVIWVGANVMVGNKKAIKDLDIGGIIVTMYRLITDSNFIRKVKEEFIFGSYKDMVLGEGSIL